MNLVITLEQYNANNLIFCDPIKNNIMNDGNFIRILYSNNIMTLNGVYLVFNLTDVTCDKYYNKYKCSFNALNHKELIEKLRLIEENIIYKYKTDKTPTYKIYEQLKSGYIKLFTDIGSKSYSQFIIKISGIWETQTNYGITYKFFNVN